MGGFFKPERPKVIEQTPAITKSDADVQEAGLEERRRRLAQRSSSDTILSRPAGGFASATRATVGGGNQ